MLKRMAWLCLALLAIPAAAMAHDNSGADWRGEYYPPQSPHADQNPPYADPARRS